MSVQRCKNVRCNVSLRRPNLTPTKPVPPTASSHFCQGREEPNLAVQRGPRDRHYAISSIKSIPAVGLPTLQWWIGGFIQTKGTFQYPWILFYPVHTIFRKYCKPKVIGTRKGLNKFICRMGQHCFCMGKKKTKKKTKRHRAGISILICFFVSAQNYMQDASFNYQCLDFSDNALPGLYCSHLQHLLDSRASCFRLPLLHMKLILHG